ncbi:MAG TPA: hypothetical protein VFV81_09290, partial [Verrucomicrobiae bacterium]|nr:hypothetical protein [Verrucomicrobiae bacterium]
RQRAAGELTGAEMVWTEGMPVWKPLDTVLSPGTPPPIPPIQPVASSPKPSHAVAWILSLLGLLFIITVAVGYFGIRTLVKPALRQIAAASGADSTAMAAASKPVVVSANARTQADVLKDEREFLTRQFVDGYKLRGERNAEWDAAALGMLSNWIAGNCGGDVDTNLPSLEALANRLANDPACTDPVVLAVAADNTVELHEMIRRLDRAVAAFPSSRHLGYPKFFATVMLADRLLTNERGDRVPALDAQSLQSLQAAFTDGSIRPADQQEIALTLSPDGWGGSFFVRQAPAIYRLVQKQGDRFQWLALTLQGRSEINQAWDARGGGYANTVSDSAWQGFRKHLATARECLTKAWNLEPNWPLAANRMMYVSLGDSDITEMRLWFDRTVAAQIDFPDAWTEMQWGLRPRWYGDLDSMMAFGVTALNTRRFDTDVPRKFFDSLCNVEEEMGLPQGQHIYRRPDVWPHLQAMYEGYIAYPKMSDWTRDGWRSTYSVIACLAGKYNVSREQLEKLHWQPHPDCLTGWLRDLSLMPMEVAARTGPQSNLVTTAEDDRQAGNVTSALKIYDQLATAKNLDPLTRSFIRERQYSLGMEQRLAAGDWVPFLPADAAFTGWQTNFGQFKVLPDGALQVSSDENGHMIYCRARVGTDFEARGQFEVVSSTTRAFQAGVVIGMPQFSTFNWDAFRIKRNSDEGDVSTFSEGWMKKQIVAPLVNLDSRTNSFDLLFQGGRVTATVNGRQIFNHAVPPMNYHFCTNECLVGLGAFNDSNSSVIRYRHVEIRRATR